MNTMYEIRTKNAKYEFSYGELVSGILIAVVCLTSISFIKRRLRRYLSGFEFDGFESSIVAIFMVHVGLWMILVIFGDRWIFKKVNMDCRMNAFAMPLIAIILLGLTLFLRRLRTRPQDLRMQIVEDNDLLIRFSIFSVHFDLEIPEDEFLQIVQVSFNMINVFQLLAWMASYVYKDGVLFGIVAVTALPTIYIAIPLMILLLYTMILTIFDRVDVVMMDDETDDESSGSDGSDVSEGSDQSNGSESEDNWSDVSDED